MPTVESHPGESPSPLLAVKNLSKSFAIRSGLFQRVTSEVRAVRDMSFEVQAGEILGVVGESGCGKSTLGKTIIRLLEPDFGRVEFMGRDLASMSASALRPLRADVQMIFQDPYASLNPRMTVAQTLKEAVRFHSIVPLEQTTDYIDALLQRVGLSAADKHKYPHEFSGGQRQRVGIARALSVKPKLLIADEPVSALDVSVQAQVLNLLLQLQRDLNLTIIFISHDLNVVQHFCDRVMVMYLGQQVELLPAADLQAQAQHPYTRALLGANPISHPSQRRALTVLQGDVASPLNPPSDCSFHPRCPNASEQCSKEMPEIKKIDDSRSLACFHPVTN